MPELRPSLTISRTLAQELLTALQSGRGDGWVAQSGNQYSLYLGSDSDWPTLQRSLQARQEQPFARFGRISEPVGTALWRFRMAEAEKGVLTLAVEDQEGKPWDLAIHGD